MLFRYEAFLCWSIQKKFAPRFFCYSRKNTAYVCILYVLIHARHMAITAAHPKTILQITKLTQIVGPWIFAHSAQ